ncbi:hypothetical protein JOB18_030127 [Solea senegalensis]|uniref:Uncharacterized protein n=1 Tax=Solea senegalensis TaxID=28829 RepID=A0AAV6RC97_SOLSE|nr:hypothetical protein JOB18_030127 [Solea senegalensis]
MSFTRLKVEQQQCLARSHSLALPRQAVIIPGEAALTQRGAPVGNRLTWRHGERRELEPELSPINQGNICFVMSMLRHKPTWN